MALLTALLTVSVTISVTEENGTAISEQNNNEDSFFRGIPLEEGGADNSGN